MKYTTIAFGLMLSLSSFAGEINGINYSSVKHETASKTYREKVSHDFEVAAAEERMINSCVADMAEAISFVVSSGYKVISTEGCTVSVDNRNSDMAHDGVFLSTGFLVLYK